LEVKKLLELARKQWKDKLVTVDCNDTVKKALDLMKLKDFSQLPVTKEGKLFGAISFAIIMKKLSSQASNPPFSKIKVKDLMDEPHFVSLEEDLFNLFERLANESFLLIETECPTGEILTSYDALMFFRTISEDFVVINGIENILRKIISLEFNEECFRTTAQSCFAKWDKNRIPHKTNEMTFSAYIRFFNEQWGKFGHLLGEKESFIGKIKKARDIRNKVCHFNGSISDEDKLYIKSFLDELEKIIHTIET
jgi:CBS domain-containing protein